MRDEDLWPPSPHAGAEPTPCSVSFRRVFPASLCAVWLPIEWPDLKRTAVLQHCWVSALDFKHLRSPSRSLCVSATMSLVPATTAPVSANSSHRRLTSPTTHKPVSGHVPRAILSRRLPTWIPLPCPPRGHSCCIRSHCPDVIHDEAVLYGAGRWLNPSPRAPLFYDDAALAFLVLRACTAVAVTRTCSLLTSLHVRQQH